MPAPKENKEIRIRLNSQKQKIKIVALAKLKQCTVTELVRGYIFDGLSKEPLITEFKPK